MLFLMIPRFPPMRGARKCATSTVATCADMGMGPGGGGVPLRVPPAWHMQASVRAGSRRCGPTHPAFSPENHPTEDHARSTHPCLRCPDTPQSRRRTGPISTRRCTDLDAELNRSRHGVRPISVWTMTDLGTEYDRSRRGCQAAYVIPRRRPSHSIWSAIATDHVAQVCLPA